MNIQMRNEVLKRVRQSKGLTAYDLAVLCGSNEARIYAIERGRTTPSRDEADVLARRLDVDVGMLFDRVKEFGPYSNRSNAGGEGRESRAGRNT